MNSFGYTKLSEAEISANRYVGLERGKILEDSNKIFKGILQYVEEVGFKSITKISGQPDNPDTLQFKRKLLIFSGVEESIFMKGFYPSGQNRRKSTL